MYLDLYKIDGTQNNDTNPCFGNPDTYPQFQEKLEDFKSLLIDLVKNNESKTFYKFGDGDFFFLTGQSVGSATPGRRALSKHFTQIDHLAFKTGAQRCDYYTCEIYPENRIKFRQVIRREIDFPAEFGYGLVINKWLMKTFAGKIGLIGADVKLNIIKNLMEAPQYQEYLGLEQFEDYISLPQKFACDDLDATEKMVGEQLKNSTSKIFLMGMGHVKSGLIHRLKKYTDAVFLDVGASIDALAGIIDIDRPYAGDWTNFQIDEPKLYENVDYLAYQGKGNHILLERNQ
jgi:hypothetical protein|tara:strand:- start:7402 stop:8265 length:864 start_codon:yes stop_codon:yes gene_type:complete